MRTFAVTFDETGEERQVSGYCRRCWPDADGHVPQGEEIEIVSHRGIGHKGDDYGATACGIDATQDGWWHRL